MSRRNAFAALLAALLLTPLLSPSLLAQESPEPAAANPAAADPTAADPTAADPTAADPTAADPTAPGPTAAAPAGVETAPAEGAPAPITDLAAEHGGVQLHYKFVIDGKPASGKIARSPDGDLRLDLSMKDPTTKVPIKTSVILLGGDPDTAFNVVHTTREMGRVALPDAHIDQSERYVFEALADETLQGQNTRHVKLTDSKSGDEFELWLAPAAGPLSPLSRMIRSIQKYQGSLRTALAAHHLDGLPLKLRYKKRSTGTVTTGLCTNIELGPVGDVFAPPRGYRNTKMESLNPLEGNGGAVGGIKKMFKRFGRRKR